MDNTTIFWLAISILGVGLFGFGVGYIIGYIMYGKALNSTRTEAEATRKLTEIS